MVFLGYSDEISELNARTMVDQFLQHLAKHLPFPIEELVFQTDNGVEFGGTTRHFERSPFTQLLPPGGQNKSISLQAIQMPMEMWKVFMTRSKRNSLI